ncbi:MAG TPA: hypothetical protein VHO71_04520 [Caproiciproducens sp.]|nr:hypothetical protein [Caproiciproducens sp.]
MLRTKPVLHTQLEDTSGCIIRPEDNVNLSGEQIDWLAEFFAPIVKESFAKRGDNRGLQRTGTDCNC